MSDVGGPAPLGPDVGDPAPLGPDVGGPAPLGPDVGGPAPLGPDVGGPAPLGPDDIVVEVVKPDDIVAARQAGHQLARGLGFTLTDVTMIATAISEIARNITSYAGSGEIRVGVQHRHGRRALFVRAEDEGPGIADIDRALEDGYSTGSGLGLGLPGARRLMDDMVVNSEPGQGTVIEMWKWIPSGE